MRWTAFSAQRLTQSKKSLARHQKLGTKRGQEEATKWSRRERNKGSIEEPGTQEISLRQQCTIFNGYRLKKIRNNKKGEKGKERERKVIIRQKRSLRVASGILCRFALSCPGGFQGQSVLNPSRISPEGGGESAQEKRGGAAVRLLRNNSFTNQKNKKPNRIGPSRGEKTY